jgi:hypothetical protein
VQQQLKQRASALLCNPQQRRLRVSQQMPIQHLQLMLPAPRQQVKQLLHQHQHQLLLM